MNILIREPLFPNPIRGNQTRSRVIEHPDGEPLPEGATETQEVVRDWETDPEVTE